MKIIETVEITEAWERSPIALIIWDLIRDNPEDENKKRVQDATKDYLTQDANYYFNLGRKYERDEVDVKEFNQD